MRETIISTLFLVVLIFGISRSATAQDRAELVKVTYADKVTSETLYTGSFALIIGVSAYTAGWDNLPGVKEDVPAVRSMLEKQGFVVDTLMDLTDREVNNSINSFIKKYGFGEENRLLIYFAGHGHTEKIKNGREIGYIVPANAPLPSENILEFRQNAISMDTIQAYAKQIQAKHALFIFDSCFSGRLVSRGNPSVPARILEEVKFPVRQFITSGAATQTVPDKSIFRQYFVRGLGEGKADRNGDGYVLASELADYLKENVTQDSNRAQTPQYGKIFDADLNRGDFVFVVPKQASTDKHVVAKPDDKTRAEKTELDQHLGKYRFDANKIDMEIAKEGGNYLFKVPAQATSSLEKVSGNRYKIKNNSDGFFLTVMENEIYLEQPQGNYYMLKVKADGTTENFKATAGLRDLCGVYAMDSRPENRVEIKEQNGAFVMIAQGQPIQRLREKSTDTFVNSFYPDTFLIKINRDANGNKTGISFVSPESEFRWRKIL